MYNKPLHRFAIVTAGSTFVLIFIGGLVTSTGSGLSVPDWPTTYGQNMFTFPIDKWIGGIKYEHGHRLVASFVGFLTVILSIWLAVKEERSWVKYLGYFALCTVIIQGILGGLTVLFLLPTAISVAHGMLAQTYFCIVSSIAIFTSQWWVNESSKVDFKKGKSLQTISILATIAVFLQLIFGAIQRHTFSGMAVPDFPFAYGQIFPSLNDEALANYNQELISVGIKWNGDKPIVAYQIVIHLIHRYWAYVTAAIIIILGYRLWKFADLPERLRKTGIILITSVIIQLILGMTTVLSRKEFIVTSFHVVTGALILMTCVITTIQIARLCRLNQNSGMLNE